MDFVLVGTTERTVHPDNPFTAEFFDIVIIDIDIEPTYLLDRSL